MNDPWLRVAVGVLWVIGALTVASGAFAALLHNAPRPARVARCADARHHPGGRLRRTLVASTVRSRAALVKVAYAPAALAGRFRAASQLHP